MRARAPGKLVLSGAYAVLEGATALVTAVDRYVEVDSARAADFVPPEVRAAFPGHAPWFDATALREGEHKLGLGSSAAILVACLAVRELTAEPALGEAELRERVFGQALAAHRAAQGGGSGVDIAASVYGGTLAFTRRDAAPVARAVHLPPELVLEAWWSGVPARTPALLASVRELGAREPARHRELLQQQAEAAHEALAAVEAEDVPALLVALESQCRTLDALGEAAAVPIVTAAARELAECARAEGAVALPAGAGGGDILLHYGRAPSSAAFRELALRHGHRALELGFAARGVHTA